MSVYSWALGDETKSILPGISYSAKFNGRNTDPFNQPIIQATFQNPLYPVVLTGIWHVRTHTIKI